MKVYIDNSREDQAVIKAYKTPIDNPFAPLILHIAFAFAQKKYITTNE